LFYGFIDTATVGALYHLPDIRGGLDWIPAPRAGYGLRC
jgi:hypothetical protein